MALLAISGQDAIFQSIRSNLVAVPCYTKNVMKNEKEKIIELENTIFSIRKKDLHAASFMADLIGVIIDVKPAMLGAIYDCELKNTSDIATLKQALNELGLQMLPVHGNKLYDNFTNIYIAKNLRTAKKLSHAFEKLWSSMDHSGKVLSQRKWQKYHKKIGLMLGYPKTAVLDFIVETNIEDEKRMARMARNRYYAHSERFEDEEYMAYDLKINHAIAELAPKTAKVFSSNKEKRWLD